jgi:hypothetical protein
MLAIHSKIFISFYFLSSFYSFLVSLFSPLTLKLFASPFSTKIALKFESKERPRKPKAIKNKKTTTYLHQKENKI